MNYMTNKSSDWFNKKFLQWQQVEGKRKTIGEFSEYLQVSEAALGHWMNGRRDPAFSNAYGICEKLQDYTLLELLGFKRVDQLVFDFMPENMKTRFINAKNEIITKFNEHQYLPDSKQGIQMVRETFAKYDIVFKDDDSALSSVVEKEETPLDSE